MKLFSIRGWDGDSENTDIIIASTKEEAELEAEKLPYYIGTEVTEISEIDGYKIVLEKIG